MFNYTQDFTKELPCVINIKILSSTPNTTILQIDAQSKNPIDSQDKVIQAVNSIIKTFRN